MPNMISIPEEIWTDIVNEFEKLFGHPHPAVKEAAQPLKTAVDAATATATVTAAPDPGQPTSNAPAS